MGCSNSTKSDDFGDLVIWALPPQHDKQQLQLQRNLVPRWTACRGSSCCQRCDHTCHKVIGEEDGEQRCKGQQVLHPAREQLRGGWRGVERRASAPAALLACCLLPWLRCRTRLVKLQRSAAKGVNATQLSYCTAGVKYQCARSQPPHLVVKRRQRDAAIQPVRPRRVRDRGPLTGAPKLRRCAGAGAGGGRCRGSGARDQAREIALGLQWVTQRRGGRRGERRRWAPRRSIRANN